MKPQPRIGEAIVAKSENADIAVSNADPIGVVFLLDNRTEIEIVVDGTTVQIRERSGCPLSIAPLTPNVIKIKAGKQ